MSTGETPQDGALPYTRHINRPLADLVVPLALRLGLAANQVSGLSFAIALAGMAGLLVLPNTPANASACTLLLLLAYVLDSADGKLARATGTSSAYGQWLDMTLDVVKSILVHGLCAILLIRLEIIPPWAVACLAMLGMVATVGQQVSNLLRTLLTRRIAQTISAPDSTQMAMEGLRKSVLCACDFGVFCMLFFLLPWPELFAWAYGLWTLLATIRLAGSLYRSRSILMRFDQYQSQNKDQRRLGRVVDEQRLELRGYNVERESG